MIRVIILDDHAIFRLGLRTVLSQEYPDIEIVGEADCNNSLFCQLKTISADIILLDLLLPDVNGVEIARRLRREYPTLKILAISSESTTEMVLALLDVGIEGFISKRSVDGKEIGEAIHAIFEGYEYFGKDISKIIYSVFVSKRNSEVIPEFNDTERQIIQMSRKGLRCKQIAGQLCLSPRTIDNYKSRIFGKLGIHSTLELVQYALKNGIIGME